MKYGLPDKAIKQILSILTKYDQVEEAVLYGSRAMNTHKKGSDIDISLKGEKINLKILNHISSALDELPLPYTFDVSLFHFITNKDLIDHINIVGKTLYKASKCS